MMAADETLWRRRSGWYLGYGERDVVNWREDAWR